MDKEQEVIMDLNEFLSLKKIILKKYINYY